MNPAGLLFVAGGIFAVLGAVFDWEWFMNSRKASFMVSLFSRNGARVFYGLLGLSLIVLGMLGFAGVFDLRW